MSEPVHLTAGQARYHLGVVTDSLMLFASRIPTEIFIGGKRVWALPIEYDLAEEQLITLYAVVLIEQFITLPEPNSFSSLECAFSDIALEEDPTWRGKKRWYDHNNVEYELVYKHKEPRLINYVAIAYSGSSLLHGSLIEHQYRDFYKPVVARFLEKLRENGATFEA